ncbi:hypothetical protein [Actinokineospora sp.]|uniref:hypothetical protein n=1 Tax=Actinokineospora sp. TaxID=1872133 RepID=UPI004037F6F8
MSYPTLAEHVADILAKLITRTIDGPHARAADTLFDAIIGRLRRIRMAGVFDVFEADPLSPARRRGLVDLLNQQFLVDPRFRDAVAELVEATVPAPPRALVERPPAAEPPRRRVWLGVAAMVAALGLVIGGRAGYLALTEPPPLGGSTPCRTFWALGEPEQRAILERVYRARNQPVRAQEPYIVAAVLYGCGQNPDRTVDQVVDSSA